MQIRNFAGGDESVSRRMTEQFIMAFDEDKAVLEAVQAAADASAGRAPVRLAIDNGPQRSRRIVERMNPRRATGGSRGMKRLFEIVIPTGAAAPFGADAEWRDRGAAVPRSLHCAPAKRRALRSG